MHVPTRTIADWGLFRLTLSILLSALVVAGCDDGGGDSQPDAAQDVAAETVSDIPVGAGVNALFTLAPSLTDDQSTFYDFPFPSDLRVDTQGRPIMTGFPSANVELVTRSLALLSEEQVGFSPNSAVYFRFDGPIDASLLPTDPAAAMDVTSPGQLINIDPSSPEYGEHLPAYLEFNDNRSQYWRTDMLGVRTVPGVSMRPGTRYAAVLTTSLRAADGGPVVPAAEFSALLDGSATGELAEHYADVFSELENAGLDLSTLVSASAFTTSDVALQMDAVREAIIAHPSFSVTDWTVDDTDPRLFRATFETLEFYGSGAPPYTALGDGRFIFDADGNALNGTVASVRLALLVPDDPPPAGGYPLVIYGHGTGGDFETHLGNSGEGAFLARDGIATLGFDAAIHGDRVPGTVDVEGLIASNPFAAREVIRQTTADTIVLYRLLREGGLTIPAAVTGGADITFDPSYRLFMGHSQGAQEAGVLLGVEPEIDSAFLSAGGAGTVIAIREREFGGAPIACALALVIGASDCAELSEGHPVMQLVVQPLMDPADPLNYARRFIKEPLPGSGPKHVVMSQGAIDELTPPRAQDALAAAIGIPIVEPVVRTSEPLDILGVPTVTPPFSANVDSNGVSVTGGMLQWAGEGHFAIYQSGAARVQYTEFFRTAVADGVPTVVGE